MERGLPVLPSSMVQGWKTVKEAQGAGCKGKEGKTPVSKTFKTINSKFQETNNDQIYTY